MLYNLLNTIATYSLIAYNFLHFKQKKQILGGVSRSAMEHFRGKGPGQVNRLLSSAGFWTVLEIAILSYCQYNLTGHFNVMLGEALETGFNYFGNLLSSPVLVLLACLLLRVDYLAQMDLITPALPLALCISKVGCFFAGCCRGVRWIYGVYNPASRLIEFPVQLLEAAVGLMLFIFLHFFRKKMPKGTVFPAYMIAFSGIRFFTEFLRCEPNVILGLKLYQILCLLGVLVGLLEWLAVEKYKASVRKKTEQAENNHL